MLILRIKICVKNYIMNGSNCVMNWKEKLLLIYHIELLWKKHDINNLLVRIYTHIFNNSCVQLILLIAYLISYGTYCCINSYLFHVYYAFIFYTFILFLYIYCISVCMFRYV